MLIIMSILQEQAQLDSTHSYLYCETVNLGPLNYQIVESCQLPSFLLLFVSLQLGLFIKHADLNSVAVSTQSPVLPSDTHQSEEKHHRHQPAQ